MLPFKQSALLSLIGLSIAQAQATVVRSDIDYQIFRDLAENKGQFTVGAQNISISDNNGTVLGQVFTEAPVMNFDAVERRTGSTTLIAPQYAVTVQHNDGNRDRHWHMQFGGKGWQTDAHHYNYAFVDKNNYADNPTAHTGERAELSNDYQTPRLSKLVTEVVPHEVAQDVSYNIQDYTTNQRYSDFIRVGAGRHYVRTPDGTTTELMRGYRYLMAGKPLTFKTVARDGTLGSGGRRAVDANGQPIDHVYEHPLSNYNASGDSGSPYYAYDKNLKRWVLMAVHVAGTSDKTNLNGLSSAILIRPYYHNNNVSSE